MRRLGDDGHVVGEREYECEGALRASGPIELPGLLGLPGLSGYIKAPLVLDETYTYCPDCHAFSEKEIDNTVVSNGVGL